MEIYAYWFLLALILIGLEMATGTFYLLMIAIAMAAGGLAALLGVDSSWQLVLCALMVVAGTVILRRWKRSLPGEMADASLDIGQPVKVLKWNDDVTARVQYRGAEWDAETESAEAPHDGQFYIKAVRGSSLVLTYRKPQQH